MWLPDSELLGKHLDAASDFESWRKEKKPSRRFVSSQEEPEESGKSVKCGTCRKLIENQRAVNDDFLLFVGSRKSESAQGVWRQACSIMG